MRREELYVADLADNTRAIRDSGYARIDAMVLESNDLGQSIWQASPAG